MSTDERELVQAHLELQREFMAYIAKNGFDYGEYSAPTPGSFYEAYRKRWEEITQKLAPELRQRPEK